MWEFVYWTSVVFACLALILHSLVTAPWVYFGALCLTGWILLSGNVSQGIQPSSGGSGHGPKFSQSDFLSEKS